MDFPNEVHWVHGIRLARPRRPAALIYPTYRSCRIEHHCAACQGQIVLGVPDQDTRNISYRVSKTGFHFDFGW
jgi:hypothetical protein